MTYSQFDPNVFIYKLENSIRDDVPVPCHPVRGYPEYRLDEFSPENPVYEAIREMFRINGYDASHFGTAGWNPLGYLIRPGETVLIKPNLVLHFNHQPTENYYSVVTHPAILRCIIDYVFIALQGKGRIIVGDAPLNNCRFDLLTDRLGLTQICSLYSRKGFDLELVDFRLYTMEKDSSGVIRNQQQRTAGNEHTVVRLGKESALAEYAAHYERFRVTEYDGLEMPVRHNISTHEYCVHRSALDADVIISVPKIKTHHKAGYTCAMKNYIGLNGSKDWLPHHRKGSREEGGDEYLHRSIRKKLISESWDLRWRIANTTIQKTFLNFERTLYRSAKIVPFRDGYFEGSWWGNATISRTTIDLNRAVIYSDREGALQPMPQRRTAYLVDGIICGEGDGPMAATSKRCNMLAWAHNAFAVDMVVVRLMGFDWQKIDTLRMCNELPSYRVFPGTAEQILIRSNLSASTSMLRSLRDSLGFSFAPAKGWKGHIELEETATS